MPVVFILPPSTYVWAPDVQNDHAVVQGITLVALTPLPDDLWSGSRAKRKKEEGRKRVVTFPVANERARDRNIRESISHNYSE